MNPNDPSYKDKKLITYEFISASKKVEIPNVLFISSAGCDFADPRKQPRLREFIEMETKFLATKGDNTTATGTSPCIIRTGFYAENILLFARQVAEEALLPLPIGSIHEFAPVALGAIANLSAHIFTGKGKHGFDDRHRGQMMVVTGPELCAGEELATAASQALGVTMQLEGISEAEAGNILKAQSESDQSELQYLLEYYSLVREGKTNYIATTAFVNVTGAHPTTPKEFFKITAAALYVYPTNYE
ncbi:hypothetical protein G7054_g12733 [Neopestalotiopsis clavispora]|nr:hypothetical protein G7054_g12733 [Neopestalotiopsis clavispora]